MKKKLILSAVVLLVIAAIIGVYLYTIPKISVYACVDNQREQKITTLWATASDSSQSAAFQTLTAIQTKEISDDQTKDTSPDYLVVFTPTNRIGGTLTYRVWANDNVLVVQPETEGKERYTAAVTTREFLTAIGK